MADLQWYAYPAILAAGLVAGFINTLAGSGSLITLPVLIYFGLPATVANGTNRLGVLLQSGLATESFRRQGVLDGRGGLMLALPAIVGSVLGAQIAVNLNETLMRQAIGVLMLVMLVVLLVEPKRWLQGRSEQAGKNPSLLQMAIFFAIGIYGGFLQAGVGIFLLAGLVLSAGYDLVRANAIKSLIVAVFTVAALVVFIRNGQVNWGMGLLLAIGNGLGGLIAARTAVKRGAPFVRWLVIVVVVVSAVNLLGIVDWVARLFG